MDGGAMDIITSASKVVGMNTFAKVGVGAELRPICDRAL